MYEIGALESIRRSLELLDHRVGQLQDRLDRDRGADADAIGGTIGEYDALLALQREQYLVQITAVRRTNPELIAQWVRQRVARLEALRPGVRGLAAGDSEADTLLFIIGRLIDRWNLLPGGYDEPVLEHPSLWERG